MKLKILILIVLFITINLYLPLLLPFAQLSANKHDGAVDGIFLICFVAAILILLFTIFEYRRNRNLIIIALAVLCAASLLYWADKLSSLDCIHCMTA